MAAQDDKRRHYTGRTAAAPSMRNRKGAPGLLDVAARSGVSGATVSRCYNHPDSVHPNTRHKILSAAADLGYIRDRAAGSLHGKASGTVGLVLPTIDNAIFAELIEAFTTQLQLHDRTVLIASHNYDLQQEVGIIRSLLERRIDGIALVGRDHSSVALEMLKLREIPVFTLWNTSEDSVLPSIGTDNFAAASKVTQHLIDLGHKDIALLFPETDNNDRARDRKEGALSVLRDAGINVPERWDVHCRYNAAEAKLAAAHLLSAHSATPSAIICGNDIIAYGVLYATQQLDLKVPSDVSVVGIGDFSASSAIEPPLTTVRLPARRIGQMAANRLVAKILDKDQTDEKHSVIPAQLIVRASSGYYQ